MSRHSAVYRQFGTFHSGRNYRNTAHSARCYDHQPEHSVSDRKLTNARSSMDSGDGAWRSRAVCGTEYTCCRTAQGGTGTTLLALRLTRGGAAAKAEAAVRSLQTAHPVLRAHLRGSSSSPTFAFPPSSSPQLSLSAQPSALDFHSLLEREINRNPWATAAPGPDGAPVLFTALYDLPDDGAALFVLIHSAVCDRAASQALLRELLVMLAGDAEVKEEAAAVEAGMERRIPKKDAWKPLWARGVDMVGYSIKSLRTSTLPFQETGTARSTHMVRLGFGREDTTRLLDVCKENGVRLCSAIAAATLLAARQSKKLDSGKQETYAFGTMINCRQFLEPALDDHNVGFFYSAVASTHKMKKGEGLWALSRKCHDSYTNAKNQKKHLTDIGDLNFLLCRALENPQLTTASALRTGIVAVFEEPATYDMSDLQSKAGVEDYVACITLHGIGPSIGVFDSIRDGQLDYGCVYPSPLHSRKQMQEIFDKVKRILVEGSTASDVKDEDCA